MFRLHLVLLPMNIRSNEITLKTSDGVLIVGDFYPSTTKRVALMLHMMPADRKSFIDLAGKLQKDGCAGLAIDLRGHGQSTTMGQNVIDYQKFSDIDHQHSINDVKSAIDFLRENNCEDIFLVGASIGANLALWALAEDEKLKGAILLSPGLNYRGIEALPVISKLHQKQKVWYIGSRDDGLIGDMIQEMNRSTPEGVQKKITILQQAGHGTHMIVQSPGIVEEIIHWLR